MSSRVYRSLIKVDCIARLIVRLLMDGEVFGLWSSMMVDGSWWLTIRSFMVRDCREG